MFLGDSLRTWASRSFQKGKAKVRSLGRRNGDNRLMLAIRVTVEQLETRTMLSATPLFWDPSGGSTASGGVGVWNTTNTNWLTASGSHVVWNNAGDSNGPFEAIFPTTGGTVTLGAAISVAEVSFTAAGYTVAGGGYSLTLASGVGQVDVASGLTATISAPIAGSHGLNKTSAGQLNLSASNTYTAGTNLSGGTLDITSDSALGAIPASTTTNVIFSGTASLQAGASSVTLAATRGIVIGSGLTATLDTQSNTFTVNGPISNAVASGVLSKGGSSGTLVLAGNNSFAAGSVVNTGGSTNVGAGILELTSSNSLGSNAITVDAHYAQNNAIATLALAGNITIGSNVTYLVGGHQPGYNDDLDSSGNNTFNGKFAIDNSGGNYAIQSSSGTFTVGGIITDAITSTNRGLIFQGAGNGILNGVINNGTGSIAVTFSSNAGTTWTVNNGQTYTGVTTVTSGTLSLNTAQPLYGTLYGTAAGGLIVVNSGGSLLANNANSLEGYGNSNTAVTINAGGSLINGPATNHITTLTLSGGTVSGTTYGTTFGGFDVQSGDTINVVANSSISEAGLVFESSASVNINAGVILTLSGSIIDPTSHSGVQLTTTGTGTLLVTGTNTNTGPTTINGGVLQIGNGGSAGSLGNGTISLASGSALHVDLSGNPAIPNSISLAGGVSVSMMTSGTATLSGVSSGSGALQVVGGTIQLTGSNTYTGGTAVTGGTLTLSNTTGSATGSGGVTVSSAATLDGSGSSAGQVTINAGGNLSPGLPSSPSNLTVGSLTMQSGANFNVSLTNANSSEVSVDGAISVSNANLVLTGTRTQTPGAQIVLINNQASGPISGVFYQHGDNSYATVNGVAYIARYEGGSQNNDLVLTDATIAATGTTFNAVVGQAFTQTVAIIAASTPPISAGSYQATINWGDGSSTGTIAVLNSAGALAVTGTHTYAAAQTDSIQVVISYTGGGGSVTVNSSAVVAAATTGSSVMNLTATATVSGPVNVAWIPDSLGESGYEVERSTDQTTWKVVGAVTPTPIPGDTLHFADANPAADTKFYYRAQGFTGTSTDPIIVSTSNIFSATTVPANAVFSTIPIDTINVPLNDAPSNPSAYGTVTSDISLASGVPYELVASGYFFLGSYESPHLADAEWTAFNTTFGTSPAQNQGRRLSRVGSYNYGIGVDDTSVDGNKYPYWGTLSPTHTYAVEFVGQGAPITLNYHDDYYADNAAVTGAPPLQVQIFPLNENPITLTATQNTYNHSIQLSWNYDSNATDTKIYRKPLSGSAWTLIQDDGGGGGPFQDEIDFTGSTDPLPNEPYQYKIVTQDPAGNSYSNIATAAYWTTVPTVSISGASTFDPSQPYTLDLAGNSNGAPPISSWVIDWGDAESGEGPDTQTVDGNPNSVTHMFLPGGPYTVTATAQTLAGAFPSSNSLTVTQSVGADAEIGGHVYETVQQITPTAPPPPIHDLTLHTVLDGYLTNISLAGGIAYDPQDNSVVVTQSGDHFVEILPDGTYRNFSAGLDSITGEGVIVTVPVENTAGFLPGDLYYAGNAGSIYRISDAQPSSESPIVSLPCQGANITALAFDNTGVFGDNLIAMTSDGSVWLIDPKGDFARIALVGGTREALVVVPNNPSVWGPYAGNILIGDVGGGELVSSGSFYALAMPQGTAPANLSKGIWPQIQVSQFQVTSGTVESLTVVTSNANLFMVTDPFSAGTNQVEAVSAADMAPYVGDILVAEDYSPAVNNPSSLRRLYYNVSTGQMATQVVGINPFPHSLAYESIVMAPASAGPIPSTIVPLAGRTIGLFSGNESSSPIMTTTTDATGAYQFTNVPPGAYQVAEQLPTGWEQTSPSYVPAPITAPWGPSYQLSVASGENRVGLDFEAEKLSSEHYPPVITSTPPATVMLGQTIQYTVSAYSPDGSPLTFDLPEHPDGMSIVTTNPIGGTSPTDPATAVITYNVPVSPDEAARAMVRVTDSLGDDAIQPFTVKYTLAAPTGLQSSPASDSEIDVSWNPVPYATEYAVLFSTTGTFPADTYFNRHFLSLPDNFSGSGQPGRPDLSGYLVTLPDMSHQGRVSFRVPDLSAGTNYYFQLRAFYSYDDANGLEAFSEAITSSAAQTLSTGSVAVPAGLTATSSGNDAIDVNWQRNSDNAPSGKQIVSYDIYRSANTPPTSSTPLYTTVSQPASGTLQVDYLDNSSLTTGVVYYYDIVAVAQDGSTSGPSLVASAIAYDGLPTLASASASSDDVTGNTDILTVTPSDPAAAAGLSYVWQVASEANVPIYVTPDFSDNDTPTAGTTRVTFHEPGDYTFNVYAVESFNFEGGGYAQTNTVTTETIHVAATLSGLKVSSEQSAIYALQNVTFSAQGIDQFANNMDLPPGVAPVWSVPMATGFVGGTIDPTSGVYSAPDTANDGLAEIRATVGSGSAAITAVTIVPVYESPLTAPTGLAGAYAGNGRVGLVWNPVQSSYLSGYNIYRSTSPTFTADQTTYLFDPVNSFYSDDVPSPGTTYYYAVRAVINGSSGQEIPSDPSSTVGVNTAIDPTAVPAAPDGLAAINVTTSEVTLVWNDNSLNEYRFDIYRENHVSNPAGWSLTWGTLIGSVPTNVTTFSDNTVHPSSAYDYVVVAYNTAGSDPSQILLNVQTPVGGPPPDSVTNLTLDQSQTTPNAIALSWSPVTTPYFVNVVGYEVYRRVHGSSGAFVCITPTPFTGTDYVDASIGHGSYDYQVTAVSDQNTQSLSPAELDNVKTEVIPSAPPAVTIVSPGAYSGNSINFDTETSSDGRITSLTSVNILVDDEGVPNHGTLTWTLTLTPVNLSSDTTANIQPITLASGTGSVGESINSDGSLRSPRGATVCSLDPTLFPSGNYILSLSASDNFGAANTATIAVSLYSQVKLGNLSLPVTDLNVSVPGGQPIKVTRVYDSQNANVASTDFGYGWSLDLSGASVSSTAQPVGQGDSTTVMRQGDLVYVTLPGGEQHVFQFWPIPTSYNASEYPDPYGAGVYQAYTAQFICVDGSGAKLAVPGDIYSADPLELDYAGGSDGLFMYVDPTTDDSGYYDPTSPDSPYSDAKVTTNDGRTYEIDLSTGHLSSFTDASGNVTAYNSDGNAVTENGTTYKLMISHAAVDGAIDKIYIEDTSTGAQVGNAVSYTYSVSSGVPAPLLQSVTIQDGTTTTYQYGTSNPGQQNFLVHVLNSLNVTTLTATYNTQGLLVSLTDANGNPASVGTTSPDGSNGSEIVSDLTPQHNTTETVYDSYGNPSRVIKSFVDPNNPSQVDYSVSVTDYGYATSDISTQINELFQTDSNGYPVPGSSITNMLTSVTQYAPFVVLGSGDINLRYTEQPSQVINAESYDIGNGDPGDHDRGIGQPSSEITYQSTDSNGNRIYQLVQYGYQNSVDGKPTSVTNSIQTVSPSGTATDNQVSVTESTYDAYGNLISSTDATGLTTYYDYTTPATTTSGQLYAGLPDGLLLDTYRVDGGANPPPSVDSYRTLASEIGQAPAALPSDYIMLSSNAYYPPVAAGTAAEAAEAAGAITGKLEYSTQWTTNIAGQTTYYAYDNMGNAVATWTRKSWNTSSGSSAVNGWTVSITQFDATGRSLSSSQGTYVDTTSDGTGSLGISVTSANPSAGTTSSLYTDQISISNPLYNDATQASTGGSLVVTAQTFYNSLGQVSYTVDQYGGHTTYTYDINGNVLDTVYPNSTETRSVYDIMGRVIWVSDKFAVGAASYMGTKTIYNSLGQVTATQRYSGVNIPLGSQTVDGVSFATTSAPAGMTLVSSTASYYNEQGQVIESDTNIGPSGVVGLRTGTVYYPDGQVEYAGLLNAAAPVGGHATTGATGSTTYAFTLGDLSSYTTYIYNQLPNQLPDGSSNNNGNNLFFADSVIDPDGLTTTTFKDSAGRVAYTVYPDGSYVYTRYGAGDSAFSGVATVPPGGRELETFDTENTPDPFHAGEGTIDVYDRNGNLTDVCQPDDGNGNAPHWQYTYNLSGNETAVADPRSSYTSGVADSGYTTEYLYDENGNKVAEVMPDGTNRETWTYNQFGQMETFTDFNGNMAAYSYYGSGVDAGMLQGVVYTLAGTSTPSETVSYTYTALGQRYQVVDSANGTTTYTYDANGNETSVASPQGTIHYVYDPLTNLLVETWTGTGSSDTTSTTDTLYGYTSQGKLASVTVARQDDAIPTQTSSNTVMYNALGGSVATTLPTTLYTYDPDGNVLKIAYPNGTETDYNYSQMWNPTDPQETVTNKRGSTVLSSFVYAFNAQREKTQSVETVLNVGEGSSTTTTINWTYDGDGRLTDEVYSDGVSADAYQDHYQYDAAGNRIAEYFGWSGQYSYASSNAYTYNADGQLTDESDNQIGFSQNPPNLHYKYDANGSLIETDTVTYDGSGNPIYTVQTSYGYDARNRMVSMTNSSGVTTTYAYNDSGDRVGQTTGSASTTYVVDDNNPTGYSQVLETWTGGSTPATTYVVGATILSQTTTGTGAGTEYIMPDGHGSTRQLTAYTASSSTNGNVVARYDYDGFGNQITLSEQAATPSAFTTVILYTGQMWDPGLMMYDLSARLYEPQIARFTSYDTFNINAGDVGNSNKYLYAGADPIRYDDPSGHDLAELLTVTGIYIQQVGVRVSAAFAAGAAAIGTFWNALGQQAEDFAKDAIDEVAPEGAQIEEDVAAVSSKIDFRVISDNIRAWIEVKYRLPEDGGSLTRAINQLSNIASIAPRSDSIVLWTLKTPTLTERLNFLAELSPQVASRVTVIGGIDALQTWLKIIFK